MTREYDNEVKAAPAYIYGLRAKNSREYFYIGCTIFNPDDRLRGHLYEVSRGVHANKHFANKVRKIGVENVVCDTLERVPIHNRWLAEKQWIAKLLADGVRLMNRIHNELQHGTISNELSDLTSEQWKKAHVIAANPPPRAVKPELQHIYDLFHELFCIELEGVLALREELDRRGARLLEEG